MSADIWCLGAMVFESLVQKKYELAWFGDLERLPLGPTLQRCLDPNPHARSRLTEIIEPPVADTEASPVPPSARVKPVQVSRKPVTATRVRPLDPSYMELVKFDPNYGIERIRTRVKSTGRSWRPFVAGAAALVLLVVVVWLVIIPKIEGISDTNSDQPQAAEQQPAKNAWPTKTLGASDSPAAPAAVAPSLSTPAPAPATEPPAASGQTWRLILGSYKHEQDADRRIAVLNEKHPDLDVKKLSKSAAGPFYVVAGDPMSYSDAIELRRKALRMGVSRASYVGDLSK
jgi:hypothetical protein